MIVIAVALTLVAPFQEPLALQEFRARQREAAAAVQSREIEPADWLCAQPLIDRNYSRPIDSVQLALRISDECAKSYADMPARAAMAGESEQAASIFEAADRTLYSQRLRLFVLEIEGRILQARRRDAIALE